MIPPLFRKIRPKTPPPDNPSHPYHTAADGEKCFSRGRVIRPGMMPLQNQYWDQESSESNNKNSSSCTSFISNTQQSWTAWNDKIFIQNMEGFNPAYTPFPYRKQIAPIW